MIDGLLTGRSTGCHSARSEESHRAPPATSGSDAAQATTNTCDAFVS
jgi:hypothetical protein